MQPTYPYDTVIEQPITLKKSPENKLMKIINGKPKDVKPSVNKMIIYAQKARMLQKYNLCNTGSEISIYEVLLKTLSDPAKKPIKNTAKSKTKTFCSYSKIILYKFLYFITLSLRLLKHMKGQEKYNKNM